MLTDDLEKVVRSQEKNFQQKESGVRRDINFDKYIKTGQITVITGARRSGKSTLLKQFSENFDAYHYLNFDDERLLDFKVGDFENLMLVFNKMHPAKTIFLDEIQNVAKWERFVRRAYEEEYKIFVTGSNANLLGSELATHLTGRYFSIELFPFSFAEFLRFKNQDWQNLYSQKIARITALFEQYLENGGFPEFLKSQDTEYLKRTYEDILYKDILVRFNVREVKSFRELANFLFSNFTKEASYNNLKKILDFKSVMSVRNYIHYLQESYLAFELLKYDFSLKKQYVSNKKIYVVDNGLRNTVAFSVSSDSGRLLENLVFLELKRRAQEIYYFKDKNECDFIIKEKNKITQAIQVCFQIDQNNRERELAGLREAMKKFDLQKGLILTKAQEEQVGENSGIEIKPVWKWLLEND